jgi:hypothetical protein
MRNGISDTNRLSGRRNATTTRKVHGQTVTVEPLEDWERGEIAAATADKTAPKPQYVARSKVRRIPQCKVATPSVLLRMAKEKLGANG